MISYYIHEDQMNRLEVHNKRWFIFSLVLLIALILTNGAWLYHESKYDEITYTETTQDGEGINIIGGGDINYGAETGSN